MRAFIVKQCVLSIIFNFNLGLQVKNINLDNLTSTVQQSFGRLPDARTKHLLESLVQHLHAFALETQLTHDEWRAGLGFLHEASAITSDSRSEFSLASDIFGLSSLDVTGLFRATLSAPVGR